MACQALHSWTLSGLLGAFIDLAITYLLLCLSTLAFFLSTFLAFFRINLPCTCTCTHPNPNSSSLVDCPVDRLSRVQLSIRTKFPFHSVWAGGNELGQLGVKPQLLGERKLDGNGIAELGGGSEAAASACSISDVNKRSQSGSGSDSLQKNEVLPLAVKGKGKDVAATQRQRMVALRRQRHRRGTLLARDNSYTSSSSFDRLHSDEQRVVPGSPSSVDRMPHDVNSRPVASNDGCQPSLVMEIPPPPPHFFESPNDAIDANDSIDKRNNVGSALGFDGRQGDAIRVLEEALEEEQAARATLWSELEKERTAAATAADEAMAMILRLQEEKASIEMEARQYQRIVEEKSAYDDEEMGILKDIIVRRECEKFFLEKQVEAYRNLVPDVEQLEGDVHAKMDAQGWRYSPLDDSSDDPMQMLEQLSQAVEKPRSAQHDDDLQTSVSPSIVKNKMALEGDYSSVALTDLDDKFIGVDPDPVHDNNELSQEIQEKGMVSMNQIPSSLQNELQRPQANLNVRSSVDHTFKDLEDSMILVREQGQIQAPGTVERNDGAEINRPLGDNGMEIKIDTDANIYDVHVIDDKCDGHYGKQSVKGGLDSLLIHDGTLNIARKWDMPSESVSTAIVDNLSSAPGNVNGDVEVEITRKNLVIPKLLPPLGTSRSRAPHSELRRDSISAVDLERLRLNDEVEWLQERLRTVQKGREKLNFSTEYRERDNNQLRLLEDIVNQLREILQLREPRNTMRQASLPPSSSKAASKRRRCRSASVDAYKSA
ncbi:hypothetical protein Dimus_029862 [Dionaea muscipula]